MSEIEKKLLPIAKRTIKFLKLDLKITSLKIFRIVEDNYLGELHKPIEKIEEFTPNSEIFVEVEVEHAKVGKCRAIIKGQVDESGHIDFIHIETPVIPTSPEHIKEDKTLKKKAAELFRKYQNFIGTVVNAIINIAIAIIKKKGK